MGTVPRDYVLRRFCAHPGHPAFLTACSEADTRGRPQVDQLGGDADWQRSGVDWMERTFIVGRYHAENRNSRLQLCVRRMRSVFEFDLATGVSQSCIMVRKSRSKLSSQMRLACIILDNKVADQAPRLEVSARMFICSADGQSLHGRMGSHEGRHGRGALRESAVPVAPAVTRGDRPSSRDTRRA